MENILTNKLLIALRDREKEKGEGLYLPLRGKSVTCGVF